MMRILKPVVSLAILAVFTACGNSSNTGSTTETTTLSDAVKSGGTVILTVASETRIGMGLAEQECYLVKESGENTWSLFYSPIEGFDYEPGYEYVIRVKVTPVENPPMDASSARFELEKVASKTRKASENMPEQTFPWRNREPENIESAN